MDLSAASTHRAAGRVTDLLELVAATPDGARLNQLVAGLDTPKSQVLAMLEELVSSGYLVAEDGLYLLGPALGDLLSTRRWDLVLLARPIIRALRDSYDETAILCANIGDSVINLDRAESSQLIRYSAPLHARRALYPSSAGKVFLAQWDSRRRAAFLASALADPVERRRALAELDQVRTDGVAFNRGETAADVSSVACPVVIDDAVVAAIVLAGPTVRMTDRLAEMATSLGRAATELTATRTH